MSGRVGTMSATRKIRRLVSGSIVARRVSSSSVTTTHVPVSAMPRAARATPTCSAPRRARSSAMSRSAAASSATRLTRAATAFARSMNFSTILRAPGYRHFMCGRGWL